jgi:hypothetical protein
MPVIVVSAALANHSKHNVDEDVKMAWQVTMWDFTSSLVYDVVHVVFRTAFRVFSRPL